MALATTLLSAALVVPSMPPPEYDDREVVTNCMFDASRRDAKVFSVQIELDATPSNGVSVVFGHDADGDGILSRLEETMAIGYDNGEWNVVNLVTGDKFSYAGTPECVALMAVPKVALLSSRRVAPAAVMRCYDRATEMRGGGRLGSAALQSATTPATGGTPVVPVRLAWTLALPLWL